MKKTYQNPTIKVVMMHTVLMQTGSPASGFNGGLNKTGRNGSDALAREMNFWEDDNEDDEDEEDF